VSEPEYKEFKADDVPLERLKTIVFLKVQQAWSDVCMQAVVDEMDPKASVMRMRIDIPRVKRHYNELTTYVLELVHGLAVYFLDGAVVEYIDPDPDSREQWWEQPLRLYIRASKEVRGG
jgi:hypothetical protein